MSEWYLTYVCKAPALLPRHAVRPPLPQWGRAEDEYPRMMWQRKIELADESCELLTVTALTGRHVLSRQFGDVHVPRRAIEGSNQVIRSKQN